jgi:hypothetical protein
LQMIISAAFRRIVQFTVGVLKAIYRQLISAPLLGPMLQGTWRRFKGAVRT